MTATHALKRLRRGPSLLGLVFTLALILRAVHWWGQWSGNPLFLTPTPVDERIHHLWAQQIASGEGLGPGPFFRAPLFYFTLAALYGLLGPNVPLARLLGCLLGAGTCVLIALLGRALAGSRAGLIAGVLAAVYWPYINVDQLLVGAYLETFLGVLLLVVQLAAAHRGSAWRYAAVGAVWGLAAITRPTVLTFAPLIALWVWFGERLAGVEAAARPAPSKRLRNLALVGVAAAATIAPATLYNRVKGGEWVLVATNGGLNFFIGNNERSDGVSAAVSGARTDWEGGYEDTRAMAEHDLGRRLGRHLTDGEVSDYWYGEGWKWIRSDPGGAFRLGLRKLARFWAPVEIPNNVPVWFFARISPLAWFYRVGFPVVAVLGIAGLSLLSRAEWRTWWLPVSYLLTSMATVVAFFVADRYRMPAIPVLMVAAGAGLARLPEIWSRRDVPRLARFFAAAAVMTGLMIACRPGAVFWPEGRLFWEQDQARGEETLGTYYAQRAESQPELWAEAVKHYEAAAAALPFFPEVQLKLGLTLIRSGRPEWVGAAGDPLERALRMRPTWAEARRVYARWLHLRDRRAEALEQYRKVLDLQPWGQAYQEALLGVGVILEQEGRPAEAEPWLIRAIENNPRDSLTIVSLVDAARWLRKSGSLREAISLLSKGLSHAPAERSLLVELADAYADAGEAGKAAEIERRLEAR